MTMFSAAWVTREALGAAATDFAPVQLLLSAKGLLASFAAPGRLATGAKASVLPAAINANRAIAALRLLRLSFS